MVRQAKLTAASMKHFQVSFRILEREASGSGLVGGQASSFKFHGKHRATCNSEFFVFGAKRGAINNSITTAKRFSRAPSAFLASPRFEAQTTLDVAI